MRQIISARVYYTVTADNTHYTYVHGVPSASTLVVLQAGPRLCVLQSTSLDPIVIFYVICLRDRIKRIQRTNK